MDDRQRPDSDEATRPAARIGGDLFPFFVTALCTAGLLVLASASTTRGATLFGDPFYFLKRQLVWLATGIVAALAVSYMDCRWWKKAAPPLGVLTAALLVLVLVIGRPINGCQRWLDLGPVNFQPSELAKFATVLMLAWWFAKAPLRAGQILPRDPWQIGRYKEGLLLPGIALCATLGLVLKEPDFGATAMIAMIGWLLLLLAGGNLKWLLVSAILVSLVLGWYVWHNPHRRELIEAWWDPEGHPKLAFQYLEARKAFMLGGLTGVGYTGSLSKQFYLPEVHTDFIFPVAAEELGLWGVLGIVLLFAGFLVSGLTISLRSGDYFSRLLGIGITLLITLQAAFNLFVVTGMLPTKGLALPFFSYGGSNLLITLVQCGVLVSISREPEREEARLAEEPLLESRPVERVNAKNLGFL
jgi:cell division protein FtsW